VTPILFLKLPTVSRPAESTRVDWALYNSQREKQAGGEAAPLSAVQAAIGHEEPMVIVLAPACQILQTSLRIPAGQKRHLQRTLPFLLEEEIASPIENMHLCTGPIDHGQVQVLAVSHSTLKAWLAWLESDLIKPDWLLPDSAALGLASELEIRVEDTGIDFFCRHQPFVRAELNDAAFVADRLIAELGETHRPASGLLTIPETLSEEGKASAGALATQFEVEGIDIRHQTVTNHFDNTCQQLLPLLQTASGPLVNLLTGGYRSESRRQLKSKPNWRALAAAVALCVGLKLVFDLGTGLYLNQQTRQVNDDITQLYRELFPQDKRIVNPRVQMQNHLSQTTAASGQSDFMQLFGQVAGALKNLGNARDSQIQQLRYNDKTQTLLVDLQVRDIQQLERFKQFLTTRNINTDILSANEDQQWIKGRIRLSL
jgi:general secretion pathway protein L